MKIAILGGSFDPPHLGHILIAQQILELTEIEEVWLMPNYTTGTHHKIFRKQLSPAIKRFEMTKLLENNTIKVSDFELKYNKKSITITTLKMLSKQYPENIFYWITGSDKLETFHLYDDWLEIIKNYHIIIFPREHMLWDLESRVKNAFKMKKIPENVIVLQNKELLLANISSTAIRHRVKNGLPINFLVKESVEKYIKKNNLYV
jgi:nicotinate-nucleotide adenylyltransferase